MPDIRSCNVRFSNNLEEMVRETNPTLRYAPVGAVVRVALGIAAGYTKEEAERLFLLDPGTKKAQRQNVT